MRVFDLFRERDAPKKKEEKAHYAANLTLKRNIITDIIKYKLLKISSALRIFLFNHKYIVLHLFVKAINVNLCSL